MTTCDSVFDQLDQALATGGKSAVLDQLIETLRKEARYYELFEALKMQVRFRLGLPLLYSASGDELDTGRRDQLEKGLLSACREVGLALLRSGKIRDGWMYLRPLGEEELVRRELAQIEAQEENLDELIEVTLHENLDPPRGFELVLQHYGTCNAITTFESAFYGRSRQERQIPARMLLHHVYHELLGSVRAHIERQEGRAPDDSSLSQLLENRDGLFENGTYHLDATHLAATVGFARELSDPESLRLALQLTDYGRRLDPQLQYPGDEPFVELYPAHARYFCALLGDEVEAALEYFRQRADAIDPYQQTTAAIEVYIDLLARLRRWDEAIEAWITLLPPDMQTTGLAPSLLELSQQAGNYQRLRDVFRQRKELLGYALGVLEADLDQSQLSGEGG